MKKFPIFRLKWVKLYSTRYILPEKNEKMTWGSPWGAQMGEKSHFSTLGLIMAGGRGDNESVMALTGFFSVDVITKSTSDNVF